jgi:hypothetical protein
MKWPSNYQVQRRHAGVSARGRCNAELGVTAQTRAKFKVELVAVVHT